MATETGGGWQWKLAAVVAIAGLALFARTGREPFGPIDVGSRAPRYAAVTLAGDSLRLRDLRDDVVLVNVWATWCPPCIREMPSLQRLHEALGPDGLRIVAVNVDRGAIDAVASLARSFMIEHGLTFDVVLDPEYRIEHVFQLAGLPMTFVIDRRGRIRRKVLGGRDWAAPQAQSEIRALLEE